MPETTDDRLPWARLSFCLSMAVALTMMAVGVGTDSGVRWFGPGVMTGQAIAFASILFVQIASRHAKP